MKSIKYIALGILCFNGFIDAQFKKTKCKTMSLQEFQQQGQLEISPVVYRLYKAAFNLEGSLLGVSQLHYRMAEHATEFESRKRSRLDMLEVDALISQMASVQQAIQEKRISARQAAQTMKSAIDDFKGPLFQDDQKLMKNLEREIKIFLP